MEPARVVDAAREIAAGLLGEARVVEAPERSSQTLAICSLKNLGICSRNTWGRPPDKCADYAPGPRLGFRSSWSRFRSAGAAAGAWGRRDGRFPPYWGDRKLSRKWGEKVGDFPAEAASLRECD